MPWADMGISRGFCGPDDKAAVVPPPIEKEFLTSIGLEMAKPEVSLKARTPELA